ncbi:hypothetical protein CRP01_20670 [Flavilitoribacter nigricans DSM 23189 = NBRC 102662]|uniref:Uncharacterized protein n=2 Tax=Flavilitoribacter TaxID=2762562 RepID=A0A2D0N7Q3_FLAN2|nr:hypothetical protein CRP01_20670 [Flavilitoribacter nigricans DSM 23189 = NBRC 102662]
MVHLTIGLSYYLLAVLPHEWMGKWIYATFFPGDIDTYNLRFLSMAVLAAFFCLIPLLFNLLRYKEGRNITIGYLLLTLTLMMLAYFSIFVLATELVHFPQYAILAILLFPLSWRYGDTLFWATLLGALDEAYQYFYLAPDRTDYYDFNDVVINFLGAALGLVFLRSFAGCWPSPSRRSWQQSPVLWTGAALILLIVTAIGSGWLSVYPGESSTETGFLLVRKMPEAFWSQFHHIRYHVVLPEEGLLLLGILFLGYSGLGGIRRPKYFTPKENKSGSL